MYYNKYTELIGKSQGLGRRHDEEYYQNKRIIFFRLAKSVLASFRKEVCPKPVEWLLNMSKILIVEDSPNDLKYYESLFHMPQPTLEVSLLFVAPDKDYTEQKLKEVVDVLYEDIAPKIKRYFVCTKETAKEFLEKNPFDFYIMDSIGGFAEMLVDNNDMFHGRLCFLSSTTPFRETMEQKGYKAYKKEDIRTLIKDCLLGQD